MSCDTARQAPFPYFFHNEHLDYQRVCQMMRSIAGILPPFAEDVLRFIADASTRFGRTYARIPVKAFYEGFSGSTDGFGGTIPPAPHSEKTRYTTLALLERLNLISRKGQFYTIHLNSLNPIDLLSDGEIMKGFMHRNNHNPTLRTMEGVAKWAAQRLYSILHMISGMGYLQDDGNSKTSQSGQGSTETQKSLNTSKNCSKRDQNGTYSSPQTTRKCRGGNTQGSTRRQEKPTFHSLISSFLQENKDLPYSFLSIIDITYSDKSEYNWGFEILEKIMANRTPQQVAKDALASVGNKVEATRNKKAKRGTLADRTTAFEQAWGKGQREIEGFVGLPTRITSRGRRLIKDQILKRSAPDFEPNDFAYWAARHWQAIGAQYFTKFKVYPEHPSMGWFIKFLEIYVEAYGQREFLDERGTRSQTDLLRKAKKTDAAIDYSAKVAETASKRIALLEAELREANIALRDYEQGKPVVNPDHDEDTAKRLARIRKMKPVDFDDPAEIEKEQRQLRRRAKKKGKR